jgi:hypothetical protein
MGILLREPRSRLCLRQAEAHDLDAVLDMHERAILAGWQEIYASSPIPLERIRARWRQAFQEQASRFAVLELSDAIIGASIIAPPWIHSLSVDPAHWGTAAACLLHEDAIWTIRAAAEPEALLRVFAQNGRARRFWEKNGWKALDGSQQPHRDPPHPMMLTYTRAV